MRTLIALVLMLAACAPVARPLPSPEPTSPTPAPTPTPTATASPTPVAPPTARLDDPIVTVMAAPFPVVATFALTKSAVAPGDTDLARRGVQYYLAGLDRYRDNGDFLPVGGAFGKAVAAALVASRTPGVKRTFVMSRCASKASTASRGEPSPWRTPA